jgi:hypothetical protein
MLGRLNQRGSSSIMLLMIWGALVGFLGIAFDLALTYVYRQQIRTAMEAAVTAGAHQGEYYMSVRLIRQKFQWLWTCNDVTQPDGTKVCVPYKYLDTPVDANEVVTGPEKTVWAPWRYQKQPLYVAYPQYCQQQQEDGTYYFCYKAEVIKDSCRVVERRPGLAVEADWQAFNDNKQRWASQLQNVQIDPPQLTANGLHFEVTMAVQAEMPTMFLRMIGFPTLPIRVQAADLGTSHGAKIVRLGDDPCRQ